MTRAQVPKKNELELRIICSFIEPFIVPTRVGSISTKRNG
jgi:hypothetical protein